MILSNLNDRNNVIETPILLIGYNRPENIEKCLSALKDIVIKTIHVSIDYIDEFTAAEHQAILEKYITETNFINYSFTVQNSNLGLTKHVTLAISSMFTNYENLIILEDDIRLDSKNLSVIDKTLLFYGDENEFGAVCGFSALTLSSKFKKFNSFRKSRYFACWGWGTTKKVWSNYNYDLSDIDFELSLESSRLWNSLKRSQQDVWLGRFSKVQKNPMHTWDIQFQYMLFKYDLYSLVPLLSLTDNQGFDDTRSNHTKGKRPKWMRNEIICGMNQPRITKSQLLAKVTSFYDEITLVGDRQKLINLLRKF